MVDILKMCKNDSFSLPYNFASGTLSHKSLQCEKIKCTCLTTLKTSIGTITISTRSSGSGSVSCTDSTAGQCSACPECWQSDSSQVLLLIFDVIQPCI